MPALPESRTFGAYHRLFISAPPPCPRVRRGVNFWKSVAKLQIWYETSKFLIKKTALYFDKSPHCHPYRCGCSTPALPSADGRN